MNRSMTYLLGPESMALIAGISTWVVTTRHNSGQGRDVDVLEAWAMWLPFVVVPLVFLTAFAPGARNWMWVGRAILLSYLALGLCGARLIQGFGMGAKGQDAAFLMILIFGTALISLGTSISGAWVLALQRPGFGVWMGKHQVLGGLLTLVAALPVGFILGLSSLAMVAIVAGVYSGLKR